MPLRSISLLNVQMHMARSTFSAEMEGEGFWIGLYEADQFMHIVPHGLWTLGQAVQYRLALRAATIRMINAGNYKGAVLDGSVYPEQSVEVMQQHAAAMRTARWVFKVKASVYSPHPIAGRQLEAATRAGHQRSFASGVEVLDWLFN